jgi:hypothetical protein
MILFLFAKKPVNKRTLLVSLFDFIGPAGR